MNGDDTGRAREAARQQALVAALWPPDASATGTLEDWCGGRGVTVARGLQAYRGNGAANVARALEAAYPTVHALIGANAFQLLARELWSAYPPMLGDLAQMGRVAGSFSGSASRSVPLALPRRLRPPRLGGASLRACG